MVLIGPPTLLKVRLEDATDVALGQSRRFDSAPVTAGPARWADIFNVRRHVNPNLATLE
jgi:hypothetical protein